MLSFPEHSTQGDYVSFDFRELDGRSKYKLLIGTVLPRPIALVTTVSKAGVVNAAPFSFFNCLSADPAILALGVENHPNLDFKDTGRNIRETEEFVVNLVSDAMVEAMNVCAIPFSPTVEEMLEAGLKPVPGRHIRCPRIEGAPAAFECKRYLGLQIGQSREIILGEVVAAHIRADALNERNHVDPSVIDLVGRMGGHGYCTTRDYFDLPTMSETDWRGGVLPERKY